MADFGSTVIIDVSVNQADAKQKAIDLTNQIITLKDKQDLLRASGQQLSVGYTQTSQAISQLQQQQKAYIALSQNEASSDNALASQQKILLAQYKQLSQAEKDTTDAGKALTAQLLSIKEQLNASGEAIGNNTGKVGGYEDAIKSALSSQVPYSNSLITLVQNTNSLAGAFGASESVALLLGDAISALAIPVVAATAYLQQFTPVVNDVKANMAGLWEQVLVLGDAVFDNGGKFEGLGSRMIDADRATVDLTKDLNYLNAEMSGAQVITAGYEAQIAELTLKLRDRNNSVSDDAKYFTEIQGLAQKNYQVQKDLADGLFNNAVAQATARGNLVQSELNQINNIADRSSATAAEFLVQEGKITQAQADQIKQSQLLDIQAEQYKTQSEQRAQNRLDQAAARDAQRAKQLADNIAKVNLDREKSALNLANATLTIREKDYADIQLDIDKRKALYTKYGQDSTNLEVERLSRISALDAKFRQENLATIQGNNRQTQRTNINSGASTFGDGSTQQQGARLQNVFDIEDVDKQITAVAARIALGERGLEEVLQSYVNKRIAIVKAGNAEELKYIQEQGVLQQTSEQEAHLKTVELDNATLAQQTANNNERLKLNEQQIESNQNLFATIADIAGKNSVLGKAAFTLERSFAIAKIIINAELQKSAIATATAEQVALASTNPITIFAVPGIIAAGIAEEAAITAQETEQVIAIAATTIASDITGKAKGGLIKGAGTGTSDSIPARLSNGESVMTAKATKMFAPILSDMNVAGGGVAFATGGIAGSYIPTLSNQIDSDNAISRSIMAGVSRMRPVVYVEDINRGQQVQSVLVENGNF